MWKSQSVHTTVWISFEYWHIFLSFNINIPASSIYYRNVLNKSAIDIISFCKLKNEFSYESLVNKSKNVICCAKFFGKKCACHLLHFVVLDISKYFTFLKPKKEIIMKRVVVSVASCLQYWICPSFLISYFTEILIECKRSSTRNM